jgi:hypothetical protein
VIQGFQQAMASGGFDLNNLTGVGDLGATITAAFPQLAPVVPNIVAGIHGAFSLAVAQTFYLGVIGATVAVIAALAIKELPLRAGNPAPAQQPAPQATTRPATGLD